MASVDDCPFGPEPHPRYPKHTHPYTPSGGLPVQCACGSRRWLVIIRPGFPVQVVCERQNCDRVNRIATAYERGRDDGRRVRSDAPDKPSF